MVMNASQIRALLLILFLVGSTCVATAADNDIAEQIAALEQRAVAHVGVAALGPGRDRHLEYHAQDRFPMCSTFKLLAVGALLKRVDENKDNLDRFVAYGEAQLLAYAPVTRAHLKDGGMTLKELCAAAIEQSDNTAGNLLVEAIGGPNGVTEFARAIGDNSTRLDRNEPELNNAAPGDERDTTTPAAMCNDLERLLMSDLLSDASRTRLERWLCDGKMGLSMIRASVPSDWIAGDKTGRSLNAAANDVAVVRPPSREPMFLAIFTLAPSATAEKRDRLVAEIAKRTIQVLDR